MRAPSRRQLGPRDVVCAIALLCVRVTSAAAAIVGAGHAGGPGHALRSFESRTLRADPSAGTTSSVLHTVYNFKRLARLDLNITAREGSHYEAWQAFTAPLRTTVWDADSSSWGLALADAQLREKLSKYIGNTRTVRAFVRAAAVRCAGTGRRLSIVHVGAHTGSAQTSDPLLGRFTSGTAGVLSVLLPGLPYEGDAGAGATYGYAPGALPLPPMVVLVEPNPALLDDLRANHAAAAARAHYAFAVVPAAVADSDAPVVLSIPSRAMLPAPNPLSHAEMESTLATLRVALASFNRLAALTGGSASPGDEALPTTLAGASISLGLSLYEVTEHTLAEHASLMPQQSLLDAHARIQAAAVANGTTAPPPSTTVSVDGMSLPTLLATAARLVRANGERLRDPPQWLPPLPSSGSSSSSSASGGSGGSSGDTWMPDVWIVDAEGFDETIIWAVLTAAGADDATLAALAALDDKDDDGATTSAARKALHAQRAELLSPLPLPLVLMFETWGLHTQTRKPPSPGDPPHKDDIAYALGLLNYVCFAVHQNDVVCLQQVFALGAGGAPQN